MPKSSWPDHPGWLAAMTPYLDPVWGDRRQEIVFIGCHPMNEIRIRAELDSCLFEAAAFQPELWKDLPDPFPIWTKAAT